MDFFRKKRFDLRIGLAGKIFGAQYGGINPFHHLVQVFHASLLGFDNRLPVPLVDIQGMDVVELLVGAYGVHIGIDAVSRFDVVFSQREPLPFGQRMNHLGLCIV